jgi:hypothetical protein
MTDFGLTQWLDDDVISAFKCLHFCECVCDLKIVRNTQKLN